MSRVGAGMTVAAVLAAAPVQAEKLSEEFRYAFEKHYRPGRSFAVLVADQIPTTSVYGIEGDQAEAHYSIDVVGEGQWKTSSGLFDTDQRAADVLERGELLELASISYKDNRVDLRMVSLEAHKVTRGDWLSEETRREPVATNFKFFLPFAKSHRLTPQDVPEVMAYIGRFFRVFQDEGSAESWSAELRLGRADVASNRPSGASAKRTVEKGMTPLEVIDILGRPQDEVSFEDRSKWTYPDLTVIFQQGRVADVRF